MTGGSGFLGKALLQQRLFRQEPFFNFDLPNHTLLEPDKWHPMANIRARQCGYADSDSDLECKVQESRYVVHCAAVADLNHAEADPEQARAVNVEGTEKVAKFCRKHGRLLVFISTACVYGSTGREGHGLTELDAPAPTEYYAETKVEGERILRDMPGLKYRICRVGTLYGPGMRPALFNYIALDALLNKKPISVHGDGRQTRTYVYIDDAVAGIWAVVHKGKDGEIYNVAGNEEVSVMQTIALAAIAVNGEETPDVRFVPDRKGQIRSSQVRNQKLGALGWAAKMEYMEGMKRSVAWMRGRNDG